MTVRIAPARLLILILAWMLCMGLIGTLMLLERTEPLESVPSRTRPPVEEGR